MRNRNIFLSGPNPNYNLFGVSNHSGTAYSGHYVAQCKHPFNDQWFNFNDTSVHKINDPSQIVSSDAYVLFYERIKWNSKNWQKRNFFFKTTQFQIFRMNIHFSSIWNFPEDYFIRFNIVLRVVFDRKKRHLTIKQINDIERSLLFVFSLFFKYSNHEWIIFNSFLINNKNWSNEVYGQLTQFERKWKFSLFYSSETWISYTRRIVWVPAGSSWTSTDTC